MELSDKALSQAQERFNRVEDVLRGRTIQDARASDSPRVVFQPIRLGKPQSDVDKGNTETFNIWSRGGDDTVAKGSETIVSGVTIAGVYAADDLTTTDMCVLYYVDGGWEACIRECP